MPQLLQHSPLISGSKGLSNTLSVMNGETMLSWMKDLFPINRSLSGDGNRETLVYLKNLIPEMNIDYFACGEKVFDWVVPDEWNVIDAYIELKDGTKIAQFKENNLHLVGYSAPVDRIVEKSELIKHMHFLQDFPEAIPYVTSYYKKNWGFCVTKQQFDILGEGPFHVVIDSSFKKRSQGGVLNYGEIYIPGISKQEILFSTYICHPSMANNELSGPVIATALAKYIAEMEHHYSYRFLFLPETIGSISYLSRNLHSLKSSLIAGWVLTCLGDSGDFSYVPSRTGNNYADRISVSVLEEFSPHYLKYSWLDRGSDERQYCAPGIDLPMCSITRSKYGTYKEYHTSADNLGFISAHSLYESYSLFKSIIGKIESQRVPKIRVLCEPQLGKRGLYPNLSRRDAYSIDLKNLQNVISYLDGAHTVKEVADICGIDRVKVEELIRVLANNNLIET